MLAYAGKMLASPVARSVLWMCLSTVLLIAMVTGVKTVSKEIHPFQVTFFRFALSILVFLPFLAGRNLARLHTERLSAHLFRALVVTVTTFTFFYALKLTPLAVVTTLAFLAPIFAMLLSIIILREPVSRVGWLSAVLGFAGAVVIAEPWHTHLPVGTLLALISALCGGYALVLIRRLGMTEDSITSAFYMAVFISLISLLPALTVWRAPDRGQWILLGCVALFGGLGQAALHQALREGPIGLLAPLDFLRLIWASIVGYVFFAETPTISLLAGGSLIVSSAYVSLYFNRTYRR